MDAIERARAAYDAKMRSVHRYKPDLSESALSTRVSSLAIDDHPVSSVIWVPADQIRANTYNPNFVAPPELKLLKVSLLEDGWTQPLVVREIVSEADFERVSVRPPQYELVDGFHRWLLAGDPDVSEMTGGRVPVVVLPDKPEEHRMASTIRHNRARGTHHVLKMSDIVVTLAESGVADERIIEMLGMDGEELDRMRDRGNMLKRGAGDDFEKGWVPG